MTRVMVAASIVVVLALASEGARACGGVGPCDDVKPGGRTEIRGFGYELDGNRLVTLKWASDGSVAAVARIDENGDFRAVIAAPEQVGIHKLIVYQGSDDPAPALVSVPVIAPAMPQGADRLRAFFRSRRPVALASGVLGAGGLLLAAVFLLRRRAQPRPV